MSVEFIFTIIFAIFTIIAFVIRTKKPKTFTKTSVGSYSGNTTEEVVPNESYVISKYASYILLGFTLLLLFFSCAYTVPVNNVGVVTSFSAPTGRTTGNGLKFVWPWERVADFDASRITENHLGDWGKGCTVVRIGSLATACVENRFQWQVRHDQAPVLYKTYKGNFDNLKNNFVDLEAQNALNAVFATYNPLNQVDIKTGQTTFDGTLLSSSFREKLTTALSPAGIDVYNVSVPLVHHDDKTEENIKKFQDVVLQSRILDQQSSNADKEKSVSDKLKVVLSPEYLLNKCIEYSKELNFAPGLCMMNSGLVTVPTSK